MECFILDKNFNLILKKNFFSNCSLGIELNDNKIILISQGDTSKVQIYKKSIIKGTIFAILRYGTLIYLSYIFILSIIKVLENEFFNFEFNCAIFLILWSFNVFKNLFFNYFDFKSNLTLLPSDFF